MGIAHRGILVKGGTITSGGGDVTVTGEGGGDAQSREAFGMLVEDSATITAGGTGNVSVIGRGGPGTGADSHGVLLANKATLASSGGPLLVQGTAGSSSGTGIILVSTVSHTGSGDSSQIDIASDSIKFFGDGKVDAGAHTVVVRPFSAGKKIDLGGAGTDGLNLTDENLDKITAGTLKIGAKDSGTITLTGNVTRPAKTDVELVTNQGVEQGNFTIDTAGGQLIIPRNVKEAGTQLNVALRKPNTNLAITHDGTNYVLTLTADTWGGASSTNITGNGTNTLRVTAAGQTQFDTITIADEAAGASVTFNDSQANAYDDSFIVELDEAGASAITFNGKTTFTGSAALSAATSKNIVVNRNAVVRTVDGGLTLQANQQAAATEGNFSGIVVSGTVEATGTGIVNGGEKVWRLAELAGGEIV
ncbi:MAG: hypothetical protein GY903_30335 [Fuerstiella sp.]|nr:hypothetical protein [Fuerstiella sp.]MCP4858793.1 hypothetical protein [Fuerstiella sp.]